MALSITHSTVVVVPDDGTSPVGTDEWNDAHTIGGLGAGVQDFLETPSSANLQTAVTGETGSGALVFGTSPVFTTDITVPNTGLHVLDTNASHDLIIKPGSNITADRTLTVTTGDTDMIVDVTATTDEYVLAYDTATNTWRGVASTSSPITFPPAWDPNAQRSARNTELSHTNSLATDFSSGAGYPILNDTPKTTGKWYAELVIERSSTSNNTAVGVGTASIDFNNYVGKTAASWAYFITYGFLLNSDANGPAVSTIAVGDVVGIAYDADAGKIWFAKNNVWQTSGVPSAGTGAAYTIAANTALYLVAGPATSSGVVAAISIHQTLTYTPPTGFSAWDGLEQPDDVREVLQTNRHYFVRVGGSDSNDGLIDDDANAFLTIQHAYDEICKLDFNGIYNVTIFCENGATWGAGVNTFRTWVGGGELFIKGNTSTISTAISHIFWFQSGLILAGPITIGGFTLTTTGGAFNCILHEASGTIFNDTLTFDACTNGHVVVFGHSAVVKLSTAYTISGAALYHVRSFGGNILIAGITVTVSGTPAFTVFAEAKRAGTIAVESASFSGSATGTRFNVLTNSVIDTNSNADPTIFPGNLTGTVATGGIYL